MLVMSNDDDEIEKHTFETDYKLEWKVERKLNCAVYI
jgi:hypothetical protein